MRPRIRTLLIAFVIAAASAATYVLNFGLYPRQFEIEWDEEVQLHDGRVIMVHIKRTFERYRRLERWAARGRDIEISFDAGPPWGKFSRKFQRYDIKMIEQQNGDWYLNLGVTTGIPAKKLVDDAYPFLILGHDGTERHARSWHDVPDFPRQNIMPVTPNAEGIFPFANSVLTWQTKMDHWRTHPRAAGDDGLVKQRHQN